MNISYLMTKNELELLTAMVTGIDWQGESDAFVNTMQRLIKKGFVHDAGSQYLVDPVICKIVETIGENNVVYNIEENNTKCYQADDFLVEVKRDMRRKDGMKIKLYPSLEAYKQSLMMGEKDE